MKRTRSPIKQYEKLEKKKRRLEEKIRSLSAKSQSIEQDRISLYSTFMCEAQLKSDEERALFLGNAQIRRIPRIRANTFDPSRGVRNETSEPLLQDLFVFMPDIIQCIFIHLGPMELTQVMRVSHYFGKIVKDTFFLLAPSYLDSFSKDGATCETDGDKLRLTRRAESIRTSPARDQLVSLLLRMWHAFHCKYRTYRLRVPELLLADLTFVCDFTNNVFVRVSDMNVYSMRNYGNATRLMSTRFDEAHRKWGRGVLSKNERIDYFNYGEFSALNMKALKGKDELHPRGKIGVIRDAETKRIELVNDSASCSLVSVDPCGNIPLDPFFDMYEIRVYASFRKNYSRKRHTEEPFDHLLRLHDKV